MGLQVTEEALASLNVNMTHNKYKSAPKPARYFLEQSYGCPAGTRANQNVLVESNHMFDRVREDWLANKKILEDTMIDMTAPEKNLTEDRLTRKSDARLTKSSSVAEDRGYTLEVINGLHDLCVWKDSTVMNDPFSSKAAKRSKRAQAPLLPSSRRHVYSQPQQHLRATARLQRRCRPGPLPQRLTASTPRQITTSATISLTMLLCRALPEAP
ncbi:hypothetical protein EI94DRAFT_1828560 [Lactarius quietus]|nr:hypothetical protein EI94DRAFT_1828560 [Lactarius quietus]